MPPKKKAPEPSKKADLKKKEKVIEDKTFGLKNKKGAKNQKFIQQVQHQVKQGGQSARKLEQQTVPSKKEEKKKEAEELNKLFRPVTTQKVEKGTDPKSVLCAFYKQGNCTKGDKCKFSHDLNIERKAEKRDIYTDVRDEDGMENWDVDKLKDVVEKKHGAADRSMPKTDIICKHFLDALESNKYGWFWECPSGGDKCHYRHALPPGFVLNKDKKKDEKRDDISIEELVETQRAQLGSASLTKVTLETFLAWKKKKWKEKEEKLSKEKDRKQAEFKAGRHVGLSGRDVFTFNPEFAEEEGVDEGEGAFDNYEREDEEEGAVYYELTFENLTSDMRDGPELPKEKTNHVKENDVAGAAGGSDEAEIDGDEVDAVPIDENLFEEDDEDLDELEENLQNLIVQ